MANPENSEKEETPKAPKQAAPKKSAKKAKATTAEGKTLTLVDLRPAKGSVRRKLRVGRGRASGAGKTSNRGHNGEGQRSGQSRKRGFEGGQMPGYRRMPKIKNFKKIKIRNWIELNVGDLTKLLGKESELTYDLLKAKGLWKPQTDGLRLLGNGELKQKVAVFAHHVTPGARQKIEAAGGSVTIMEAPVKAEKA